MNVSPKAGKPPEPSILIDVPKLVDAYYACRPDSSVPAQRVVVGTSGHRGCSLDNSFNEVHVLAITQAICLYRKRQGIDGPLYIGFDTHALSQPAFKSASEVLAGNGIEVMVDAGNGYTPTPVISHAILSYNRSRRRGLADGIVITPLRARFIVWLTHTKSPTLSFADDSPPKSNDSSSNPSCRR